MKRGLITWDASEISPAVFAKRVEDFRRSMVQKELPAIAVYSDLWRSSSVRFLSNYMPYFNRALLIVPLDRPVTLLCGLSPRVYPWIRSVTTIEDVRAAGNFSRPLFEIAAERKWQKIGVVEFPKFPYDLHRTLENGPLEIVNIDDFVRSDENELAIRRRALRLARDILHSEIPAAAGCTDHEFNGRLERRLRMAGAEDLVTLLTNGDGVPAPASGKRLEKNFSISLALEYRGHWVRVTRPHDVDCSPEWLIQPDSSAWIENLGGSYPYECIAIGDLRLGSLFAVHVSRQVGAKKVFYGDTCWFGGSGPEIL